MEEIRIFSMGKQYIVPLHIFKETIYQSKKEVVVDLIEKLKEILHEKGECACCDDVWEFIEDLEQLSKEE